MRIDTSRTVLPLLLCLLVTALPGVLSAQPDTRGREFYLTFPPNYHNNINQPFLNRHDSLYIFIAATNPTRGRISYRNIDGNQQVISFLITDPSKVYTFGLPWQDIELRGFYHSGTYTFDNQSGSIALQSFRITADDDVSVYALNRAQHTSDAMLVLPTDALGTFHRVLSYTSDGRNIEEQDTPSQFAVVAVSGNTRVTITPTAAVMSSVQGPRTVTLNAGEVYFLQADLFADNRADLTGTIIESSQPVAVFAGHKRASIPVAGGGSSRDYLIEQIPPVSSWGKSYILTPFPQPDNQTGIVDLVRVLASTNGTIIAINGVARDTLAAGEFYEQRLLQAELLTASHNVLVAQYKGTADGAGTSDPFMIVVPPRRQFLRAYQCINAQAYVNDGPIYTEQYMTVICHRDFAASLTVDGVVPDASLFQDVPGTCYVYAWLPTTDGSHIVEAQHPFGLYVFGYGSVDSYGYTGGMAFLSEDEDFVAVSPDTVVCIGTSVQLSVVGGISHSWSPATGLSCTDCPDPVAQPAVPTEYTVAFLDAFGCSHQRVVRVDVRPYPTPAISNDTAICAGQEVQLHASGGMTYHWTPPDGLSCTDCPNPIARPKTTTVYRVEISNGGTCRAIDSVTIGVEFLPIDALPDDTLVCVGDALVFDLPPAYHYQWSPATGLSCTDCPNPTLSIEKTTKYTVVMENNAGCRFVQQLTVTVTKLPIVSVTPDLTLCPGDPPVRLLAKGGNFYRWTPADGLSCTNCPEPLARPTTTTTYSVDISITNVCKATTTVTIVVPPAPHLVLSDDTTVCAAVPVQLHASGGTTYAWSPAEGLSCTDCPEPVAMPDRSTVYTVTATTAEGCSTSGTVAVSLISLDDIAVSGDTELCRGATTQIQASGGITYAWSPAEGLSCTDCPDPLASPTETTVYTVQITGAGGCSTERRTTVAIRPAPEPVITADTTICRGQSVTLAASGGTQYAWTPADGLSCTNCPEPVAHPSQSTRYTVEISDGACTTTASVLLTVQSCSLTADIAADTFPPQILCDSARGRCIVRNTGEEPLDLTTWRLTGPDAQSFTVTAPDFSAGYRLQPQDSLVFAVLFHPHREGQLSAVLTIAIGNDQELSGTIRGTAYRRTALFSLGPDILATAGDTVALDIHAQSDSWQETKIGAVELSISYPADWIIYAGRIDRGEALDGQWSLTAEERDAPGTFYKTLWITASGDMPIARDGTLATLHIVPLLARQPTYTPELAVSTPGRQACVISPARSTTIDLSSCAQRLRPVRFGRPYGLDIDGGTVVSRQRLDIRYTVGLPAPTTLEVYDHLGRLIERRELGSRDIGEYRHEFDARLWAPGLYVLRFSSGPFGTTLPFLLTE